VSSPEFNEDLVSPLTDEALSTLAAGGADTGVQVHRDQDDWSKIHVRGNTHWYALYVRDVQGLDETP
jgi:hypothetical protein